MNVIDLPAQLAERIEPGANGCWIWKGAVMSAGYGNVRWEGRYINAHRLTYHLLVDPTFSLSPGRGRDALQIDHLCRVKRCVNPQHLEPVTAGENSRRNPGRPEDDLVRAHRQILALEEQVRELTEERDTLLWYVSSKKRVS